MICINSFSNSCARFPIFNLCIVTYIYIYTYISTRTHVCTHIDRRTHKSMYITLALILLLSWDHKCWPVLSIVSLISIYIRMNFIRVWNKVTYNTMEKRDYDLIAGFCHVYCIWLFQLSFPLPQIKTNQSHTLFWNVLCLHHFFFLFVLGCLPCLFCLFFFFFAFFFLHTSWLQSL